MALIIALILLFASCSQSQAQSLQDLSQLQNQYKTDCSQYYTKKQIDLQYNTINSNQEYLESSKVCLITRNKMLGTYMAILENNLNKYKQINSNQTSSLQSTLHQSIGWLQDQNQNIINFQTKDDIKNFSKDFQKKYQIIKKDIYKSIGQSESNKYSQIKNELNLIAQTNPKILSDLSSRFNNTNSYFQNIDIIIQNQQENKTFDDINTGIKLNLTKIKNEITNIRNTIVFYYAN